MFEPGTKVVCVDGRFPAGITEYFNALPIDGEIYTVRDIVPGCGWRGRETDQQPAVYLVELVNLPNHHGVEPGFACRRFAELEEAEMQASASLRRSTKGRTGPSGDK